MSATVDPPAQFSGEANYSRKGRSLTGAPASLLGRTVQIAVDGSARAITEPTCGSAPNQLVDIGAFQYPIPVVVPPCVPPLPSKPETRIVKAKIAGRNAKFSFAASGATATGFECKLDAKPWRKCVSPKAYKHLKPGVHSFRVRAFGPGGIDPTPAKRRFRIHRQHSHHHG